MRSEVLRKLRFLSNTRLVWRRPPKVDVALIDDVGAEELIEYFPGASTHVVKLYGSTNVWAFVRAILRGRTDLLGYTVSYLELMKPRVAATLIDTTPFFYRLKDHLPQVTTIAIQNGWRSYESKRDFEAEGAPMRVDHLLCFGEVSKSLFAESISGTFHVVGSFRSNKVPVYTDSRSKKVALISTLRSKVRLDDYVPTYSGNARVPYSTIFERRLELAKYVAEFCRDNSLSLLVLGKEQDDAREQALYTSALEQIEVEWEFRPRTDLLSNYRHLNEVRMAVSTSSSLGYEALSRGIRTAFFMLDPEVTGNFGDRFGWPEPLGDSGEIWANFLDRSTTLATLRFLHELDDNAWNDLRRNYVPRLISADPGNRLLQTLTRQALDTR